MTRYIDWEDVVDKYADVARVGGASETREPYMDAAEDEIDGWLSPRYTVPFTPCPGIVKDLCVDIAYYKMTIRQKGADVVWTYIEKRLKAILDGTLTLVVSGTPLEITGQPIALRTTYVSSNPPIGGDSVGDPCFFLEPQS